MKTIAHCLFWILPLVLAGPAFSQIAQEYPELCGDRSLPVPVPEGVSAVQTADIQGANFILTLQLSNGLLRSARLPSLTNEIRQVCPVGEHLVVFAWDAGGAYEICIIDMKSGSILDSFLAYDPVMSPDRRWLVMRVFYPYHTEFVVSEEYALYDLRASPQENRHGPVARSIDSPGWAIYPVLENNFQVEAGDVPDAQTHQFMSRSFYWDATGRYVVFADIQHDTLSVVLSRIEDSKITTWVHPLAASELCSSASESRLSQATVSLIDPLTPVVIAQFSPDESRCLQKPLTLTLTDFKPAEMESYPKVVGRPSFLDTGEPATDAQRERQKPLVGSWFYNIARLARVLGGGSS